MKGYLIPTLIALTLIACSSGPESSDSPAPLSSASAAPTGNSPPSPPPATTDSGTDAAEPQADAATDAGTVAGVDSGPSGVNCAGTVTSNGTGTVNWTYKIDAQVCASIDASNNCAPCNFQPNASGLQCGVDVTHNGMPYSFRYNASTKVLYIQTGGYSWTPSCG